jgi:hypothetical protein
VVWIYVQRQGSGLGLGSCAAFHVALTSVAIKGVTESCLNCGLAGYVEAGG